MFCTTTTITTGLASLCLLLLPTLTTALGINCRGSGLCHLATVQNDGPEGVMQLLRDGTYSSTLPGNTTYSTGEHIICVSGSTPVTVGGLVGKGVAGTFTLGGNIRAGGICAFLQCDDCRVDLASLKPLMDALLEHGCGTCGSVPIHEVDQGSNDPAPGILTFNYVDKPVCTGQCIGGDGTAHNNPKRAAAAAAAADGHLVKSAKFVGTEAEGEVDAAI